MGKVIIMRGAPGSGKSTYIKNHFSDAFVCSADHFFERDGVYTFDSSKIGSAHAECLRKFTNQVQFGSCGHQGEGEDSCLSDAYCGQVHGNIVVDNTNISAVEIAPYAALALAYGWELEIITLDVEPEVAAKRNVHGVPAATVKRMHKAMEYGQRGFMKWWNHRIVKES